MALPFPVIYMSSSLATQVANKTSYNNNQVLGWKWEMGGRGVYDSNCGSKACQYGAGVGGLRAAGRGGAAYNNNHAGGGVKPSSLAELPIWEALSTAKP